jgi:hypothetical protein
VTMAAWPTARPYCPAIHAAGWTGISARRIRRSTTGTHRAAVLHHANAWPQIGAAAPSVTPASKREPRCWMALITYMDVFTACPADAGVTLGRQASPRHFRFGLKFERPHDPRVLTSIQAVRAGTQVN